MGVHGGRERFSSLRVRPMVDLSEVKGVVMLETRFRSTVLS